MDMYPVISVKEVSKCYKIYDRPQDRLKQSIFRGNRNYFREFWALKNVSFEVFKGETVGIIGRNGSGKSTLLQIIAGTLTPTNGVVDVKGRVAALLELGSGFNPEFSGHDNVYMNGSILGLSQQEIDLLYDEIINFADIGEFINQPVKTYSSGMAVRLAFAVQAMVPKEVLIVDEALAVGDELFQRKCYSKIEEFKRQGGTVLFVSHSGSSIIELCDRAILMDSGESLLVGSSKRVVNLYQKYIYSTASNQISLRDDIKNLFKESTELSKSIYKSEESHSENASRKAFYDSKLEIKETLDYTSKGAVISNEEITTLQGNRVNVLLPEEKYIWKYNVKFNNTCTNVRFGMLIKTTNGVELGGAVTAQHGDGIPLVDSGSVLKVEFSFTPKLNEGTYFMNGGVMGFSEDGETFLHRKIDAAAFRIIPKDNTLMTAIIDFDIYPEVIV
jgi:lipopolysaccharide transport system ATP-binding protein